MSDSDHDHPDLTRINGYFINEWYINYVLDLFLVETSSEKTFRWIDE